MHIEIDYDGTMAVCTVTEFDNPNVTRNFNYADKMTQVYALSAMRCVKEHWEREWRNKKE